MKTIEIGRYDDPQSVGYFGWVCPVEHDDNGAPAWCMFVPVDGSAPRVWDRATDTVK